MSVRAGSTAKLKDALREAPVTVPTLVAIGLFVLWATDQTGFPVTHWAPGGLILLALLAIALSNVPLTLRDVPVAVRVALTCLALYTVVSFLSIAWAAVPADAWEGANRTLLYLVVFALFALWPQRGVSGALLLGTWTMAMIGLAAFVMLHIDASSSLGSLFSEGRLKYPAGYENASAATWAMVMWPALLLAACKRIPWGMRGLLAGGIGVAGGGRAAQPEPRLAVRDAGDADPRVRAAPGARAHVRGARACRRGHRSQHALGAARR